MTAALGPLGQGRGSLSPDRPGGDDGGSKGGAIVSETPAVTPGQEPGGGDEEQRFQAAKRRAENLQGLYIHLIVYAIVNGCLFAINALTRGEDGTWWCLWVMGIWGIGLLIHLTTFLGVFSPDWAERKARDTIRRNPQS